MKNSEIKFNRIDSDISDSLKSGEGGIDEETEKHLKEAFKEILGNDKLKVEVEKLKSEDVPAVLLLSEQSRRLQDLGRMFGGFDNANMFPGEETLVLNGRNPLIKMLADLYKDDGKKRM